MGAILSFGAPDLPPMSDQIRGKQPHRKVLSGKDYFDLTLSHEACNFLCFEKCEVLRL
jgi:hypothetical protein